MATFLERLCDAERLANRDSVFLQRFDDYDTGADPKLISLIDGEYGIDAAHGTPLEYSGTGIQLLPVAGGPGIGSNQTGDIASRYNEGGLGGSAFVMAWHGWCEVRASGVTYEYVCGDLSGATGNAITIRHSGISNRLGIYDGALRDSFYTLTTGYHSIVASKQLTGGLTDIFVDGYLVASVTALGASGGQFAVGSVGKNQSGNRSNSYTTFALYARYLTWNHDQALRWHEEPESIFEPRRIWVPVSAGGGAQTGAGSSEGVATAAGVGASTASSSFASSGAATPSVVGASTSAADAAATGSSTAAAESASGGEGVASASGSSETAAVGASTAAAAAASSGVTSATSVGASIAAAVAAADGVATASAASPEASDSGAGAAAGAATATGVSAATVAAAATAAGTSAGNFISPDVAGQSSPGYRGNPRPDDDPLLDAVREKWSAIERVRAPRVAPAGDDDDDDQQDAERQPPAVTPAPRPGPAPAARAVAASTSAAIGGVEAADAQADAQAAVQADQAIQRAMRRRAAEDELILALAQVM